MIHSNLHFTMGDPPPQPPPCIASVCHFSHIYKGVEFLRKEKGGRGRSWSTFCTTASWNKQHQEVEKDHLHPPSQQSSCFSLFLVGEKHTCRLFTDELSDVSEKSIRSRVSPSLASCPCNCLAACSFFFFYPSTKVKAKSSFNTEQIYNF